ncbi:MAG: EAL domain-containing protein [Lachnospiraceae bacterium]|nr:EAL domain-containing protein [Lachnospiraceae bacterium]
MMILLILEMVLLLVLRDSVRDIISSAYIDVTGIQNKKILEKKVQELKERNDTLNIGIMLFDLNNLKQINDNYGHEAGDELIQTFASFLVRIATSKSFLARFGGDEFVIIQEETKQIELEGMERKLQSLIEEYNKKASLPISYAVGYDVSYKNHYYLIEDLLDVVDKKMYEDKIQKKKNGNLNKIVYRPAAIDDSHVFADRIQRILLHGRERKFAMLMSEVEKFRLINENSGYEAGDEILNILGGEFAVFEGNVMSGRYHADVFFSILDVTDHLQDEVITRIENRNRHIEKMITEQYRISYFQINTGVQFLEDEEASSESVISAVNIARKEAKKAPKHICVYTAEMGERERMQGEVLYSFQSALEKKEFIIYFQPKVDAKTRQISSAEVLVRWKREDGTIWTPNLFIPPLEKTDYIIDLDFCVYEQAFCWLKRRQKEGLKIIPLSVNVSRRHLIEPDRFTNRVFALLGEYEIEPENIIFEITESAYMEQPEIINDMICRFHKRGIRISMDDFGSMYSSLYLLQNLTFDEVKIDQKFLANELTRTGKIVLQETFHMLKRMQKFIVCEGVESIEVENFLRRENCDELQGFLFYKPMDEQSFEETLCK